MLRKNRLRTSKPKCKLNHPSAMLGLNILSIRSPHDSNLPSGPEQHLQQPMLVFVVVVVVIVLLGDRAALSVTQT